MLDLFISYDTHVCLFFVDDRFSNAMMFFNHQKFLCACCVLASIELCTFVNSVYKKTLSVFDNVTKGLCKILK
jgi:hypothetical protein